MNVEFIEGDNSFEPDITEEEVEEAKPEEKDDDEKKEI